MPLNAAFKRLNSTNAFAHDGASTLKISCSERHVEFFFLDKYQLHYPLIICKPYVGYG